MRKATLSQPPLRELVIDIQVSTPPDFDASVLASVAKQLEKNYPIAEEQYVAQGQFLFKKGDFDGVKTERTLLGSVFKSKNGKNLVQFRSNGFTINKIKPYSSWEAEILKAKKLWPIYKDLAKPLGINRIAVRAINDIVLPNEAGKPDKLLKYHPRTPTINGGVTINNFVKRHQLSVRNNCTVNIVLAYEGKRSDHDVTFLLDIDIYKTDVSDLDDKSIWEQLDQMNDLKNEIFLNNLTQKGLEVFK